MRQLFETNGAHDLISLPCISPIPSERIIFLSKAIRLVPWLPGLDYDVSNVGGLHEALCSVMGSNYSDMSIRLLSEDFLVQNCKLSCNQPDMNNEYNSCPDSQVTPLFQISMT